MKKTLSAFLLVSMAAGCASPGALNVPAPMAQAGVPMAAAPQAKAPVVATNKTTAQANKALASPIKTTPALNKPNAALAPIVKAPEKALATWDDFDPMKALSSLPAGEVSGPDLADDDSDEDSAMSTKSFSTQGWLWGWGGVKGRDRGLRTFAEEEGKVVEWLQYPNGWTAMRAVLTPAEVPGAIALAVSTNYNRVPTTYKFLPKPLNKQTTRHLKFFRKQDIVDLKSKHLMYYQVQKIGSTVIAGYIARAENSLDRYIAYYDAAGHFLWAYGSNYPMYGYNPTPTSPLIISTSEGAAGSESAATP